MRSGKIYTKSILEGLLFLFCFSGCDSTNQVTDKPVNNGLLSNNNLSMSLSDTSDIIVNSTSDQVDFGGAMEVNDLPGPDELVTLREAIIASNNSDGPQIIGFNIPLEDPGFNEIAFTIQPLTPLPILSNGGLTIDGSTQTDFTGNTNEAGPEIVIDGGLIDLLLDLQLAFDINSPENHIHSVVITHFQQGISVHGTEAQNNRITGCYIGTDPTGTIIAATSLNDNFFGIGAQFGPSGLLIGGAGIEERNIIAGYTRGIFIENSTAVTIENNFIGMNVNGTIPLSNIWGITLTGAGEYTSFVTIRNNLVSGNIENNITFSASHDILIIGNHIGPDINGYVLTETEETWQGIAIDYTIPENVGNHHIVVGGPDQMDRNYIVGNLNGIFVTGPLEDIVIMNNIIKYNSRSGVCLAGYFNGTNFTLTLNEIINNKVGIRIIEEPTGYKISQNKIYSNELLGIDIGDDGITPNDPGDLDTGPNNLMNYPVLTSAKIVSRKLIVQGKIDTQLPRVITLEFFANPSPIPGGDPSGYGEGAVYLGTARPNSLQGRFIITLPKVAVGTLISATATDAFGNTSEFSRNISVK